MRCDLVVVVDVVVEIVEIVVDVVVVVEVVVVSRVYSAQSNLSQTTTDVSDGLFTFIFVYISFNL